MHSRQFHDRVRMEVDEASVAVVSLTRPDKHNGFDLDMMDGLLAAAKALKRMRGLRAVVLRGDGPSFCAGLDFKSVLSQKGRALLAFSQLWWPFRNRFQAVNLRWRELPVPVVAAIVEHEGQVILARNVAWPTNFYALITGFLERGESPEEGVQREVQEELGLTPRGAHFVGLYDFARMNQLIIAYHVPATGTVTLNEELADWKHVPFEAVQYWPAGTGYALRDWLRGKGFDPQEIAIPGRRTS